ncbi:EH domain-containing protein 2 isoform C [Glycine soja]|uniref:EH domain-containing protein 2 isoform C n=1 Tax=Glycine soja TaxID=3848 RepID=A0A445JLB6_GLYSO|nr:EH domain-containing protein 2 isoform C [Glycine soja]
MPEDSSFFTYVSFRFLCSDLDDSFLKNQCRPGGSHALPEGIIFDTSDLEMRNLWDLSMTKTIENKENASTNLFAMAVGIKQKDLVNKMVKKDLGPVDVILDNKEK